MNEQKKYEVIKKLVETDGNKDRAALSLGVTRRHINRLIKGYKEQGKAFFVHGNRGRKPSTTISDDVRDHIITLYNEKYYDANFTHFTELLVRYEGIHVSVSSVRNILEDKYILSSMVTRAKQKRIRRELSDRQQTAAPKEAAEIQKNIVAAEDAIHVSQEKRSSEKRNSWMHLHTNGSETASRTCISLWMTAQAGSQPPGLISRRR